MGNSPPHEFINCSFLPLKAWNASFFPLSQAQNEIWIQYQFSWLYIFPTIYMELKGLQMLYIANLYFTHAEW